MCVCVCVCTCACFLTVRHCRHPICARHSARAFILTADLPASSDLMTWTSFSFSLLLFPTRTKSPPGDVTPQCFLTLCNMFVCPMLKCPTDGFSINFSRVVNKLRVPSMRHLVVVSNMDVFLLLPLFTEIHASFQTIIFSRKRPLLTGNLNEDVQETSPDFYNDWSYFNNVCLFVFYKLFTFQHWYFLAIN